MFYQTQGSEDWKLLDQITKRYNIINQEKYKYQLRFFLNNFVSAGSSMMNLLNEDNAVQQGITGMSSMAYYRLNPEEASLVFRYWVATNKTDFKSM